MVLFDIEELGLTSYVSKNMDIKRIEHDYFVEWRLIERGIPGESFFAFGKLNEDFPLDEDMETMFAAHNIDTSHFVPSEIGGRIYPYQDYTDGEIIDGYFELFEHDGKWFYKHYHGEYTEYNGGVYHERLDMFMDSIEWH